MNKDLFYRNFEKLKEKHPQAAARVSEDHTGVYELVRDPRQKMANLAHHTESCSILLYDANDPFREIRDYLSSLFQGNTSRFLVLLGFGLGYVAEEILRRETGLKKMIVIERDPACLRAALGERDLTDLLEDERIRLIVGCTEEDLYVALYNAVRPHFTGLKELKFVPWPASVSIAESYYRRAASTFREIADTYGADRGNDPYDTLVAYEHFFLNINELLNRPGARYFKDFFKNRPAVVVATGPSLKKNIGLLKEIEDSAVIISADASLRILNQHNIYPHLVTTIERPPGYAAYYEGLEHLDKTVFAAAAFLHPSTLKAYTGPMIFFHRLYTFMMQLGFGQDAIHMGISTAHMAYEVGRHMGCDPIILVGNDLAFDSSGHTHAPGFILGEKQPYYDQLDRFEVPGNVQPVVQTCEGWFAGIKQYEERIADWPGTLINATEGGARIRGSRVAALRSTIDAFCRDPFYPREALRRHMADWTSPYKPQELLNGVNGFISRTDEVLGVCKKLRPLLDETLRDIERHKALSPSLREQLDKVIPPIETVLNSMMETEFMRQFDEYLYTDIFPLLTEWQVIDSRFRDPYWAKAYRVKLAEEFVGGLGQLCISLKETLLDGQQRLQDLIGPDRE